MQPQFLGTTLYTEEIIQPRSYFLKMSFVLYFFVEFYFKKAYYAFFPLKRNICLILII